MNQEALYTIGHGRRKISELITLLKNYEVRRIVDVRSVPFSRFNPQYNQKALAAALHHEKVEYIFMGDTLGGRPKDPYCYDEKGKPDFDRIKVKPFFLSGISALKETYGNSRAAIMCSESDPAQCHRCKLIGEVLQAQNVRVLHIDKDGSLKTQDEVIQRISNKNQPRLF